jgi:hypothetical protein
LFDLPLARARQWSDSFVVTSVTERPARQNKMETNHVTTAATVRFDDLRVAFGIIASKDGQFIQQACTDEAAQARAFVTFFAMGWDVKAVAS